MGWKAAAGIDDGRPTFIAPEAPGARHGLTWPCARTHVLSSGVAGTMAANGSGMQWSTVRNLATAWVLTLPAAIALSAGLYWVFHQML